MLCAVSCAVCRKLSDSSCLSPVQENIAQNSTTSLTAAEDGDTAVELYDRCGRGICVRGAGLDEYDGPARLSAAEARGRAHNVPDTCGFFVSCQSCGCNEPLIMMAYGIRLYFMIFFLMLVKKICW